MVLNWLLNRSVALFPRRGVTLRRYRMMNWQLIVAPQLEQRFAAVCRRARREFWESLYVRKDSDHRTVSLWAGVHPVGSSLRNPGAMATEDGAALVFSQSVTGSVAVLLYPFESEFMHQKEDLIVWRVFEGPTDVTRRVIDAALVDAFRYWRVSSVFDGGSWWDRWRVGLLRRRDRYRSKEKAMAARPSFIGKAVGEFLAWWPVAAVLAFSGIVTIVTGWHDFADKVGDAFHVTSGATGPVPANTPQAHAAPTAHASM
ncbi:hypothetical protein R54767_04218 [Paraburkholderia gardini]|uniref:Uncharacterized protein n=2 Tax=Paraburkholderia gardini TaxID=2823469 RepID=A0ABM8U8D6_9BURK|nr:hypothetical protein R54767_04218 [Paraburkholderia gardini]